jgi:LacI family transcriptional regulator
MKSKTQVATSAKRAGRAAGPKGEEGKVTLEMVALAAGVSPSTVSRILNGTAVVSDDKRQAVDHAIATLGFVPNPVARGLAGGRTLSVGVVTQTIDSPFFGGALRGIESELSAAGYSPLFVSGHWNVAHEARCIDVLRSRRVDGIIVLAGRLGDAALSTLAQSLPVVATGRSLVAPGLLSLNFDNFEGGRLATHHLLQLGHRRIAFITGDTRHPDAKERQRGYRAALEAAGVTPDPALVVPGQYTEDSGRMAVERLLDSRVPFSAIFAANDQMAFGAMLGLHRRRLQVPRDASMVGFDDVATATFSIPPLTTVHHPVVEMGQIAARAMLDLLAGKTPDMQLPGPRLVVRESTRAPRDA